MSEAVKPLGEADRASTASTTARMRVLLRSMPPTVVLPTCEAAGSCGTVRNFVRGGRLKQQSDHGHCEALAEQDGELGLGHGPLARRHHPLLFGAVQHQEKEFCGGVITREMPPGSDGPAEFGIQSLDGIR